MPIHLANKSEQRLLKYAPVYKYEGNGQAMSEEGWSLILRTSHFMSCSLNFALGYVRLTNKTFQCLISNPLVRKDSMDHLTLEPNIHLESNIQAMFIRQISTRRRLHPHCLSNHTRTELACNSPIIPPHLGFYESVSSVFFELYTKLTTFPSLTTTIRSGCTPSL